MQLLRTRIRLVAGIAAAISVSGLLATVPAQARPTAKPAKVTPSVARHPTERACGAARRGYFRCFAIKRTDVMQPHGTSPLPSGYSPAELKRAYQLPDAGAGRTVAIIDAFADPNVTADLEHYRATFKQPPLAPGQFEVLNQDGASSPLPSPNDGWAGEISLDVDMVSAVCPRCNIVLFEADSNSTADLATAVDTAVAMGITYISNSYGAPEYPGETTFDSVYNRPGVVMTASTGDSGYGTSYPAAANRVVAVGGTALYEDPAAARGFTEYAWSGAGSGCSAYETRRLWQIGVPTHCRHRAVADVSAVADPNTGVAVYNSYGGSGWNVYGGTSASAPIIAAVYALAGSPGSNPSQDPYNNAASLNDVVIGSNGSCSAEAWCTAEFGWDGPTGLGSPNGVSAFHGGPAPSKCQGNALQNRGFESGDDGRWSNSDVVVTDASYTDPHRGSWYADLGGYPFANVDYLTQTNRLPSGCTVTLSFWYRITTDETTTTSAFDTLEVATNGRTRRTLSNLDRTDTWTRVRLNLNGYSGKMLSLSFTSSNDGSLATSFFVDDVQVTLRSAS